ncbi:MAG: TrmH family RNA methyltransferase [Planctomycetia bacterium]
MNRPDEITSPANPRVRAAAGLRDADARRTTGLTLIDGLREISRALAAGIEITEAFLDQEAAHDPARADVLAALAARQVPTVALARRPFDRIAFGSRNEGIVVVARFAGRGLDAFAAPADRPVLVVEGIEKPGNLGAILRTCDAAGIAGVIACGSGTDPANPAVIRASLGTVFTLPLAVSTTPAAIAWCAGNRRRVVAATPEGRLLWHQARLDGQVAILLGSEAFGISSSWRQAADAGTIAWDTIRLPMHGIADSLNVAATAAILAYESLRQQTASTRDTAP